MKNNSGKPITDARTLGWPKVMSLGAQHLFTLFASTVLVPILTGLDVGVALVMSGVGTLLFHFITKWKAPSYLGSSISFVAPILVASEIYGLDYARGGIVVAGLIYVVVAFLVHLFGAEKIIKYFPPIVTGPIIMVIGVKLAPVAIKMASKNWIVALFTMALIVLFSVFGKGFLKIIPVIIGLIGGYILSVILGLVDFTPVAEAAWFGIPSFGLPKFNLGATLIIAPIALTTVVEHVGDVLAMSGVVGKNLAVDPGLSRTLIGDGLATSLSAMFGGPANTTYSQNTGVLALTKVFDPLVMRVAAAFAICLGFIPKLAAVTRSIPPFVIGGAVIILFGMITSIGARTLVDNHVDFSKTRNMIIIAITMVFGLGGATLSFHVGEGEVKIVGMAMAAIAGIILNIVLPEDKDDDEKSEYDSELTEII